MKWLLAKLAQATTGSIFIETLLYDIGKTYCITERQQGCFVMNTISEFAGRNPGVTQLMSNATSRMLNVFVSAVKRGQVEDVIPGYKDPKVLGVNTPGPTQVDHGGGIVVMPVAGDGTPTKHTVEIEYNFEPSRRLRIYQFDPLHHDVAIYSLH